MRAAAQAENTPGGIVVVYSADPGGFDNSHEAVTWVELAKRIATLLGYEYAGEYERSGDYKRPTYFLPSQTIVGIDTAHALGIRSAHDLFGGVVPYAFVGSKAIVHPLVDPAAQAPPGWRHEFGERVRELVPFGFSAFTPEQAKRAGKLVLERGPARIKPVHETGGRRQRVVCGQAELDAALAALDPSALSEHGVVVEENLTDTTTYTVGQVRVRDMVAAYYGTQRLTTDERGATRYGGSELVVFRGCFDTLLKIEAPAEARLAIVRAHAFDTAATELFPEFFASRRNYDVISGIDSAGTQCCAVLEQSWRVGGASGAEVAALQAFQEDPELSVVRASSIEFYGEAETVPAHATVYFRGKDEEAGRITKYTVVERYGDA